MDEAGLPAGWLNALVGSPAEIADDLIADERVRMLTFTGSAAIGWSLRERAARQAIIGRSAQAWHGHPREAVARSLGTSRIPVREALHQLETEELIILIPHVGARVATLDLDEYTEIYKIREHVEPLAIAESIARITMQQHENLRRASARSRKHPIPGHGSS